MRQKYLQILLCSIVLLGITGFMGVRAYCAYKMQEERLRKTHSCCDKKTSTKPLSIDFCCKEQTASVLTVPQSAPIEIHHVWIYEQPQSQFQFGTHGFVMPSHFLPFKAPPTKRRHILFSTFRN